MAAEIVEDSAPPTRWSRIRKRAPKGAVLISIVAFVSSQFSCFLSWRTHSLTQRPYLGIESATASMHQEDNCDNPFIAWKITSKNVGPTPIRLLVREHRVTFRSGEEVLFTHTPDPGNLVVVLPEGTTFIEGRIPCSVVEDVKACKATMCHVKHGTAKAETTVRMSYWGPGWLWGYREYRYEIAFAYQPGRKDLMPLWTLAD